MAPQTTSQNCASPACQTQREVKEAVLDTKLSIILALTALAAGLLSYSVFWQAPNLKADVAKEVNRLDKADVLLQNKYDRLEQRVSSLERR